jgi:plasmid stability protein
MAVSITVRSVPDETRDELAARAARSGRSLQEYLKAELVELARRPDPELLWERIHARKTTTGSRLSADDILAYRDADRT